MALRIEIYQTKLIDNELYKLLTFNFVNVCLQYFQFRKNCFSCKIASENLWSQKQILKKARRKTSVKCKKSGV
jgi:hypothetical protein